MIIEPKLDKLDFTIKKSMVKYQLDDIKDFFERNEVKFTNSPSYWIVHLNPTKLIRPNLVYDNSMKHNLQMNEELLLDFLEEFEKISIPLIAFRVKEIHIAKDRIMDNPPEMYNAPLIDDQTRYKGRTKAFKTNNGTSPSVRVCNDSESLDGGESSEIDYDKPAQLEDEYGIDEITPLEPLTKEEIKILGNAYSKYTGRIKLDRVNMRRSERRLKGSKLLLLPHEHEKLTLADIVKMLKEKTLIENINRVFVEEKKRTVFPEKKAPTKGSELDRFLVSGDMSQFDNLFDAMGIYSNYKEYTNSVISEEDMLLNEIYEKFVEM